MTAQNMEEISYKRRKYSMAAEPFGIYLEKHGIQTVSMSTANWRGYHGEWKIKNSRLYLVSMSACILKATGKGRRPLKSDRDYSRVDLNYFFPGQKEVFAEWFSGEIRIPIGKMLAYIHMGYESLFEKDLIIGFKDGIKIFEKEIDNHDEYSRLVKSSGMDVPSNSADRPTDLSFYAAVNRLMAFAKNNKVQNPKESE